MSVTGFGRFPRRRFPRESIESPITPKLDAGALCVAGEYSDSLAYELE